MSTINVNKVVDTSGGVLAPISSVFRNRIINGAMVIDQRNAGASITGNPDAFPLDRWQIEASQSSKMTTQQQTSVVPTGFTYALSVTSSSAYSVGSSDNFGCRHIIEGFNCADLGWGTANAQPATLSFWVRSSLTGTFTGAFCNGDNNYSYPFTYTISAANTWEQKTVTVVGPTAGTWGTTNGRGIQVRFNFGSGSTFSGTAGSWAAADYRAATGGVSLVGTNGATFYITGVQLEKGSTATSFDYRPYGTELALCQRYFYMVADGATKSLGLGTMYTSTSLQGAIFFPVTMRATPTLSATTGTNYYEFLRNGAADGFNSLDLGSRTSTTIGEIANATEVSGTVGHSGYIRTDSAAVKVSFSSEL
jgi:hypothetical protein